MKIILAKPAAIILILILSIGCKEQNNNSTLALETKKLQCGKDTDCAKEEICEKNQCIVINSNIQGATSNQTLIDDDYSIDINTKTPSFKDFPISDIYSGHPVQIADPQYRNDESVLKAINSKPKFAGVYAPFDIATGYPSFSGAEDPEPYAPDVGFINLKTGEFLKSSPDFIENAWGPENAAEFGWRSSHELLDYKVDSNLLVAKDNNGNINYYVVENNALKLFKSIPDQESTLLKPMEQSKDKEEPVIIQEKFAVIIPADSEDKAKLISNKLTEIGLISVIQVNEGRYRIKLGPYDDLNASKNILERVSNIANDAFVVALDQSDE